MQDCVFWLGTTFAFYNKSKSRDHNGIKLESLLFSVFQPSGWYTCFLSSPDISRLFFHEPTLNTAAPKSSWCYILVKSKMPHPDAVVDFSDFLSLLLRVH